MSESIHLPEPDEVTELNIGVAITHRKADDESDSYLWSDPAVDIIREVRKALLKHPHIKSVDIRVNGNLDAISATFADL